MNKITQKPQLLIEYVNLNKAQTDSFRHKMIMKTSQLLTKESSIQKIQPDPIPEQNPSRKSIFIKKQALQRTLSVYQWRYKTCYPVLKPLKLTVKSFTGNLNEKRKLCKKNSQSPFQIWNLDENIYELLVTTQKVNYRLSELGSLPLPQLFYLLKEILVGFECLIDIFGIFEPTEDMISVNQTNQWRFWISQDFASNSKKQSNLSEAEFILKILKMVESRLPSSKVGVKFFQELKNLPVRNLTFLNLLDMTNIFISFNKILVAKKFVSVHLKNNLANSGSKHQNYFKINRTFNEFKQTSRYSHNYSKVFFESNSQVEQHQSAKHIPGSPKFNSIKNPNEINFSHKVITNQSINRQTELKKQKQLKSYMKISQFYTPQILSLNNIQKRASFMYTSSQTKQKEQQQNLAVIQKQKTSTFPVKPNHNRTQTFHENNLNKVKLSPYKRQRKFSVQNVLKTTPNFSSNLRQSQTQEIQNQIKRKSRKNSYYNYEKPVNKQAFSESPNKSSSKQNYFEQVCNEKGKEQKNEPKRNSINYKRENILMNEPIFNRSRKYSEHAPRIKSLDEFAKKSKKMFESSTMEINEINKEIKYCNLKSKDIACHNRHATISGMAFGQYPKKSDTGFNNINNDLYNGKFEEIMKSMKSPSNGDKDQNRNDFQDPSPRSVKRRATLFDMVRQIPQVREEPQHFQELSPQPQIRVSCTNNQTAQTLNKSEMNIVKGSQQSNSLSNNNNYSNIRESDTNSNQKSAFNQNRKGLISQSNLSNFSCKTYQPVKDQIPGISQKQRQKQMANSQDCFNFNNPNQSESSEQFLKSNNWNKKISGLFSDVASIKVLKQSSHFGQELEFFEKDYLKNVKLQKLDKLGKQLKGSILEEYQYDQSSQTMNIPTRGLNNKSFSLIGEVKEEPYQNDPSYLEYSTSMICQSRHNQINNIDFNRFQTKIQNCQSFQEMEPQSESTNLNDAGFNFTNELYNISQNQ